MTSAVTLAQIASIVSTQAFKNRVINGDMRIDQRFNGALMSYTSASSTFRGVDRFYAINNVGSTGQISSTQQRVAVTDTSVPHDFAIRMTVGNTAGRTLFDGRFQHNIEGNMVSDLRFGTANADSLSASFWIRGSKSGRAHFTMFNDGVGTQVQFLKTINITTTWQYVTISVPPCTISGAGIQRGNTRAFGTGIYWATSGYNTNTALDGTWQTSWTSVSSVDDFSASGDWIEMTGYQIEKGTAATGFDYRPAATELQLCQRYFYRVYGIFWTLGVINQPSGSWTLASMSHPTAMRTNPTFGHNLTDANRVVASPTANQWSVYNQNVGWGSISFSPASTFQGIFNGAGSTVQGHAGGYYTTFTSGATHIGLGSNLYIEWDADI
jgi:hypothetical protein